VVYASTCPPPNRVTQDDRRPPKGPFVASDLRARLKQASDQLKADGHPEKAGAVDAVLAPGGWSKLRGETGARSVSTLAIYMTESLREALKEAADQKDVSLGALVTEGFQAAAEGRWTPPSEGWAPSSKGSVQRRVNLTVRVEASARKMLDEALPRLAREAERPRLTVTGVAIDWLIEELGVEDD
jgi:hypothetical protein